MAKLVKFYDIKSKKAVMIPEEETQVISRYNPRSKRRVKMLTAVGPQGNKLYKIIK